MKIRQEILGTAEADAFAQVKKKFRSRSQIREAIREYSPEAEKNGDEKQATLREIERRLLSAGAEGARCAKRFKDSVADVSCIIAALLGLKTITGKT